MRQRVFLVHFSSTDSVLIWLWVFGLTDSFKLTKTVFAKHKTLMKSLAYRWIFAWDVKPLKSLPNSLRCDLIIIVVSLCVCSSAGVCADSGDRRGDDDDGGGHHMSVESLQTLCTISHLPPRANASTSPAPAAGKRPKHSLSLYCPEQLHIHSHTLCVPDSFIHTR